MRLQLSGKEESGRNMYEPFPGRPIDTMPVLIEQGYEPGSVALIIDRRINAPEEVRSAWRKQYFWTSDSASTDETGNVILTLDAKLLRTINPDSKLFQWGLKLDRDGLETLKADDTSITLSPEAVQEAYGNGVTKQNGLWLPVNPSVGRALGHYLRGMSFENKDFQEYAQNVSEASRSGEVLRQYFDRSKPSQPNLRSVVVLRAGDNSDVDGGNVLNSYDGLLVGVAPEAHSARENVVAPTLEQVLRVTNQYVAGINRKDLRKELSKLYK